MARQLGQKTDDRFLGLEYEATPDSILLLTNAAAWLECSVENEIAAGDHNIVLFRLHRAAGADGIMPLVFHSSEFYTISPIQPPRPFLRSDML